MKCYSKSLFTLFFFIFLINPVFSAEITLVSEEKLQERINVIENLTDMDEGVKKSLLELYFKTLDFLDTVKVNNQQSELYTAAINREPEELKTLETELEEQKKLAEQLKLALKTELEKSPEQVLESVNTSPLSELEQKLNSELAKQAAITAEKTDLGQRLGKESDSSPDIKKLIVAVNHELESVQKSTKIPVSSDLSEQEKVNQWLLDAHREALRSELKKLNLELLSQPARLKLLKLKKVISDFQLKTITAQVTIMKHQVELKRSAEIQATEKVTRSEQIESYGKHDFIQSLAKSNTQLSERITTKTNELIQLDDRNAQIIEKNRQLNLQQTNTKRKLEIAGLNQILGQVLWEQKKALPDSKSYLKKLAQREKLLAQSGLENLQYQEELERMSDEDDYLMKYLGEVTPETRLMLQDDLKKLIKTRKGLLTRAVSIDEKYLKAMSDLDFSEKKFIESANNYSVFLDEHLFWLRSAAFISLDSVKDIFVQLQHLLNPSQWLGFAHDFIEISLSSPFMLLAFVLVILLLVKRNDIKEQLVRTGLKTKKISTDSLNHTWKAIFYTLLLAAPLPILLLVTGWQLANMPEVSIFTQAVSKAMLVIALPLFSMQFSRYMCFSGGLFEVHFKWSGVVINGLKQEIMHLMITFLPIIFLTVILISIEESSINGILGRLLLLLAMAVFGPFFYRLLKPGNGLLSSVSRRNPKTFFARYQTVLLLLCLMIVMILMGLTIVGYVYSAVQLTASLIYSIWFVFALVVLQQISVRWLLLTRRKYALKKAYEKRKQAQLERLEKQEAGAEIDVHEDIIEFEEPEIDIDSLSEESKKLLNLALFLIGVTGFISIWSEVLPALGIFENIVLWHHEGIIDGTKKSLPITLADLGLAILVIMITVVSAKRLPAIIEIFLINSAVSSGSRYTTKKLINYSIVGIGFFSVFNLLGANWERFQWLFAALGVGIGFGLQEIVANFISGLIILFERPIRVGDQVSVGGNDGVVTKIRIRATTILTFDRKELLVPNKEFITGQLLNWTFSDQSARLTLPVGVAYGSDIPLAKELLLQTANENERVLEDPAPNVIFVDFGDNTLNLHLRCYIDNIDNRMATTSALNEVINEKFNAAGISIAFPQRDVHLDINQPIDIRMSGKYSHKKT